MRAVCAVQVTFDLHVISAPDKRQLGERFALSLTPGGVTMQRASMPPFVNYTRKQAFADSFFPFKRVDGTTFFLQWRLHIQR